MSPLGEELTTLTPSDQLLDVGHSRRPVKSCSKSLSDQCSRGCVVATGSSLYVFQEFGAIILGDTLQQNFCIGALAHESSIDQGIIYRSPDEVFVLCFVLKISTI